MSNPFTSKHLAPQINRVKVVRRHTARQRHYHCTVCGYERRSFVDLRSCPSCGSGIASSPH